MIEKALQLRHYLEKNPEMVVDSLMLKQMFVWLMDNYVVNTVGASDVLKESRVSNAAAAPDQVRQEVTR